MCQVVYVSTRYLDQGTKEVREKVVRTVNGLGKDLGHCKRHEYKGRRNTAKELHGLKLTNHNRRTKSTALFDAIVLNQRHYECDMCHISFAQKYIIYYFQFILKKQKK